MARAAVRRLSGLRPLPVAGAGQHRARQRPSRARRGRTPDSTGRQRTGRGPQPSGNRAGHSAHPRPDRGRRSVRRTVAASRGGQGLVRVPHRRAAARPGRADRAPRHPKRDGGVPAPDGLPRLGDRGPGLPPAVDRPPGRPHRRPRRRPDRRVGNPRRADGSGRNVRLHVRHPGRAVLAGKGRPRRGGDLG